MKVGDWVVSRRSRQIYQIVQIYGDDCRLKFPRGEVEISNFPLSALEPASKGEIVKAVRDRIK